MNPTKISSGKMADIVARFCVEGTMADVRPYGSGHINDTYVARMEGDGSRAYVFQRINHTIFKDVECLMSNILRVTAHLRRKLAESPGSDLDREALVLVPARDGRSYLRTRAGEFWRAYNFIDRAGTYDVCTGPEQACEAARAFGRFQQLLIDLPGGRLAETLPHFHHTPRRFEALEKAIAEDRAGRCRETTAEIDFCMARKNMAGRVVSLIEKGKIPERITHNDTKLNNVMMDNKTGRALCVIDLDTVMPGSVLYDFGDMVRTFTPTALEDELDLSKVNLDMDIFRGLVKGYLGTAGRFLTDTERRELVFAGKLITFTIGIRFLADYLAGDVYFKTQRACHNLDRARTQFKMVGEIEKQRKEMERIVAS